MSNNRQRLEELEALYGEAIEQMVVGKHYDRDWSDDAPHENECVVVNRETGLALVDYEYDSGFGGADCHPIYAWTASRVFLVHEYDGATGLVWVPRAPAAVAPEFGGQDPMMDFINAERAKARTGKPTAEK